MSYDGSKIILQQGFDIFTMNIDGSNQTNITNTVFNNEFSPENSKDGSDSIVYVYGAGDYKIYTMNIDGSNQTRLTLTTGSEVEQYPSWSF